MIFSKALSVLPDDVHHRQPDKEGSTKITRGGYGTVVNANWGKQRVVVKRFEGAPCEAILNCAQELLMNHLAASPYTVMILGYVDGMLNESFAGVFSPPSGRTGIFALSRWEGMTLHQAITCQSKQPGGVTSHCKAHLLKSTVKACIALHGTGVIHGDLKNNNLVVAWGPHDDKQAGIIDLGVSREIGDTTPFYSSNKIARYQQDAKSAPVWIPPEIYGEDTSLRCLSRASDVYAMGIVWLFIISGGTDIHHRIRNTPGYLHCPESKAEFLPYADDTLVEIIFECFNSQPSSRPNFNWLEADFGKIKSDGGKLRLVYEYIA